ncbi:HNH endonuclease family protein [Streptomyces sp. NPDC018031]|uniref:HNH endonuclease family protein n=1 Tax=Streptomyces sp. NPDC018031 TaxID=3365033 RepID=UPI00379A1918
MATTLQDAVRSLPVEDENRAGYSRTKFKHWVDADRNGCDSRREVLIQEATVTPAVGARCSLTGGTWYSYYDGAAHTSAQGLDIDHMVPLAEAWDSGASGWSAQDRQDYANDLGDARSLVAVTAHENRSKADQDPAQWLPSNPAALCRYISEWVAVKTRWALSVDSSEALALRDLAAECPTVPLTVPLAR